METKDNKYAERDAAAKALIGPSVRRVTVDGHEPGIEHVGYAKFPGLSTLSQMRQLMETDEMGALDQMFNKCMVKDLTDNEIFADQEIRFAVMQALPELINKKKARLQRV